MKNVSKASTNPKRDSAKSSPYHLTLYVAGNSSKSQLAMSNLRQLCDTHLSKKYRVEIVDLYGSPGGPDMIRFCHSHVGQEIASFLKKNHSKYIEHRKSVGGARSV